MLTPHTRSFALLCTALLWCACSDDSDGATTQTTPSETSSPDAGSHDAATDPTTEDTNLEDTADDDTSQPPLNPDCDPLDPIACALPWPSNLYLQPDDTRATGHTLQFGPTSFPANTRGDLVSPENYTRFDGYGVGTSIIVHFPNIDTTPLPSELNLSSSLDPSSPILLLEEQSDTTLQPIPYWAEVDLRAQDPTRQVLFVRPAVVLRENTRYIVAMRQLRDTQGNLFEPSTAFASLLQNDTQDDPHLAPRQERFNALFDDLRAFGVDVQNLQLAWDFNTASSESLHGPMLHMRDDAFERVGPQGPALTITDMRTFTPEEDERIAIELQGTFRVPHYMKERSADDHTGFVFNIGPDGKPQANGERDVRFWAMIPHRALDPNAEPSGLIQYGHGLLGEGDQVFGGFNRAIAQNEGFVFFACSLAGMSSEDFGSALALAQNLNNFTWMSDRLHQGILEYLLLTRAFKERLSSLPELADTPLNLDTSKVYYSGISQGGIFGTTFAALSKDIHRVHLGVPGNNYRLLLTRSVDFDPYLIAIDLLYPDPIDKTLFLAGAGILWEGTEPISYIRHLSNEPFPGHDPSYALYAPAKGDYQVSPLTLEIAARSSDLDVALLDGYGRDLDLIPTTPLPHTGSGIVLYDFGNPWPSPGNVTPSDDFGDPHGKPRRAQHHNAQMIHFFRTGEIIDVCGGDGCTPE